jgi:DNA-binding response OmpR family regulator
VEVAGDGPGGIAAAKHRRPDLIILDLMLPGADGFTVLSALRRDGMDVRILILSAKSEEADKVYGFGVGADDFVTKPFGLSELLARVNALLRRSTAPRDVGADSYAFGDVTINVDARTVTKGSIPVSLTPKEFELLLEFARHPSTVLSRARLLRDVWGHAPDIQTRTVDIHIGELRRKLEGEVAEPRHFVTVWKAGYRFDP